ncbi:MAG: hypothetical protein IKU66_05195 [Clostridia bacterium]|nr:hypothetical protein [Clostridia bacterium]
MFFEDPEKCPLLEDSIPQQRILPHCVIIYDDLTLWTIEELCYKNFIECPTYKKVKEENSTQ